MKVTTDACLFGAWVAYEMRNIKHEINTVLDIGTGTGLLTLMYAQKNPGVIIDAIEIDEEAAEQAKENVAAFSKKNQVQIICADARSFSFPHKYDLIISNPPFYEKNLVSSSSRKNIAHHNEGLLIGELLKIISENLKPTGIFCLLSPFQRNEEIKKMFSGNNYSILQMVFVQQSAHHDYFRIMLTGARETEEPVETKFDEISVWDDKQQYSSEFIELLKDYYLYL
jgi:tRNA1Val (adenine37-N6)-methyltransferase